MCTTRGEDASGNPYLEVVPRRCVCVGAYGNLFCAEGGILSSDLGCECVSGGFLVKRMEKCKKMMLAMNEPDSRAK